jgi:hypothetical protein
MYTNGRNIEGGSVNTLKGGHMNPTLDQVQFKDFEPNPEQVKLFNRIVDKVRSHLPEDTVVHAFVHYQKKAFEGSIWLQTKMGCITAHVVGDNFRDVVQALKNKALHQITHKRGHFEAHKYEKLDDAALAPLGDGLEAG